LSIDIALGQLRMADAAPITAA